MISDQNIRDYYEVVTIGAVDEDTIEVFRNILYNKIEKESKTDATQELWEMYIRLMRRLKRNYQTKHGWRIEDIVTKERLKYKGLIYEKNKDDEKHNLEEFKAIWNRLSWVNTTHKSVKELHDVLDKMEELNTLYTELTKKKFLVGRNIDIRELDAPLIKSLDGYLLEDVLKEFRRVLKELYNDSDEERATNKGVYKEQLYYRSVDKGILQGKGVTLEDIGEASTVVLLGKTATGKTSNSFKLVSEMVHSYEEDELEVNILKGNDRMWGVLERHPNVKRNKSGDLEFVKGLQAFISEYERREEVYKYGWTEENIKKDPLQLIVIDEYEMDIINDSLEKQDENNKLQEKLESIMKEKKDLGMRIIATCFPYEYTGLSGMLKQEGYIK